MYQDKRFSATPAAEQSLLESRHNKPGNNNKGFEPLHSLESSEQFSYEKKSVQTFIKLKVQLLVSDFNYDPLK